MKPSLSKSEEPKKRKIHKPFLFVQDDIGEDGEAEDRKPTPIEARIAQYEKPLTKGHRTTIKDRTKNQDPDKVAKRKTEKRERSQVGVLMVKFYILWTVI